MDNGIAYRMTDISGMRPRDVRRANLEFLKRDDSDYDIPPGQTKLGTRKVIRRVSDGDLARLFDDFPENNPLEEQCALWVHAVAGKHYFPDANHRTAVATLRELLSQNGLKEYVVWPGDSLIEATRQSKEVRQEVSISLDTLYRRDVLFEHWLRYFETTVSIP